MTDPDQPLPGMASTASLPTPEEIIARANLELSTAYRALGDAADWLRSDWAPDSRPAPEQADAIRRMRNAISRAKNAINEGRP